MTQLRHIENFSTRIRDMIVDSNLHRAGILGRNI